MHFHGRGRKGKRHLQRRFLRRRGAAAGELAPRWGAVAQRLRGFKSAEPEKTVKRSSRRTGVNLQFFPVQPSALGLKGASSPFFVAPARRNRWWFSGSLLPPKENIPRRQAVWLQLRQLVQILSIARQAVLQKPVGLRAVHGLQRGALLR